MKIKKIGKIISRILLVPVSIILLFIFRTYINHRIKTSQEIAVLKEKGYFNPVSVGDYSPNAARSLRVFSIK